MALLQELFSSKRKVSGESESRDSTRSYKITKEQVRLLLFKECDWRGRKILFDSSTIEKVAIDKNVKNYTKLSSGAQCPCVVEVSDGFAYKYKGPASDSSALGEMMFGAVAMNYTGVSLKIHLLNDPHRLMCTKVFGVPALPKTKDQVHSAHSTDASLSSEPSSSPLLVPPFHVEEGVSLNFSFDRGDSGFYGDHSPNSSVSSTRDYSTMFDAWGRENINDDAYSFHTPPSGRKLSSCSNGSWQRRMLRSLSTRFDLNTNLLRVPSQSSNQTGSDSQMCSTNGSSVTCDSLSSASSCGSTVRRRTKLGLALLITLADTHQMEMLRYCAEHSPQLEAMFCRLRMSVMLSGIQRRDGPRFIATMVRATADAVQWLTDLLNGPRLSPTWLNLVSPVHSPSAQHRLADSLVADLCSVLHTGDTKHTKFFISTLLTHVLTFHLGWVSTVSPYEVTKEDYPQPCSTYNALWAQLSDLCGSIGCPPRSARTIITGRRDKNFINKLLSVLTYFIRCGDVKRNLYKSEDFSYGPLTDFSVTSVPINEPRLHESTLRRTSTSMLNLDSLKCNDITECSTNVSEELSITNSSVLAKNEINIGPVTGCLKKSSTVIHSLASVDLSELSSPEDATKEPKSVVFVLGDDDRLVGLKNKSSGGKSVKKSSRVTPVEPLNCLGDSKNSRLTPVETLSCLGDSKNSRVTPVEPLSCLEDSNKSSEVTPVPLSSLDGSKVSSRVTPVEPLSCLGDSKKSPRVTPIPLICLGDSIKCEKICDNGKRNSESPTRCCSQQTQHSKPIKHSGFKFEFDKYPQIVTNYMKSKNLEILDRHYIGKPGNLKLDNFQFDPMVVPPIQEEKCENCYKCQLIESTLQTPTNASEFWSDTNEDQLRENPCLAQAKETIVVEEKESTVSPKTFVRKRKKNTVVINLPDPVTMGILDPEERLKYEAKSEASCSFQQTTKHLRVIDVRMPSNLCPRLEVKDPLIGFHTSLLGGLTDHYVPDMILHGTLAAPSEWESDVRRDLDLMTHINKTHERPLQAVAIIADSDQWAVRVMCNGGTSVGGAGGAGLSPLVGAMLDALPHMRRARVPAHQCLSFVETKLREVCVLSKSLADLLMSHVFCDMETLTKSLSIDANDVPLLLAVAGTHTPDIATRYGLSYR